MGLITGLVFCLDIDGDITKEASKSGGGGGGEMCPRTLNWFISSKLIKDFEQYTYYYTTKLVQRTNDYNQPVRLLHCRS